ncbi:hypothetical protein NBT05_08200 [Aquimarina sp. ERC-38]|uniref:hypothetical protein n=1 Tax=Aquimarina sp. ERC-38 TaxID=2949996 RepID=UPI002245484B|nr:hypothetical protein [Aquimarina sp. ERC-38]UZO82444.1 hypothetical protein NBT05_08200 [Aquimarina sp. ERC-38]
MMRNILLVLCLLYAVHSNSQDTSKKLAQNTSDQKQKISKNIPASGSNMDVDMEADYMEASTSEKEDRKEKKKEASKQDKLLRSMARERAVFLQKELDLDHYTSLVVQKKIYQYSKKANEVIQSELPYPQKTTELNSIIYAQNDEMKELLTVDQFYKYKNLKF